MHGKDGNAFKTLFRKIEVKRPLGRLKHRWEEILKRIFVKCVLNSSGWGPIAGPCECGNESSGSTNAGYFLNR
jgi:hypothetical protein